MAKETQEGKRLTDYFTTFAEKWVSDSYVIALVLTILAYLLALIFTGETPYKLVQDWGKGFWSLLTFAMQMVLIVITGYALATTPLCQRLLGSLCSKPKTTTQVYLWGMILSGIAYYLNWGFGLVFAALVTKELAIQAHEKGIRVDYRVLCGATWTMFFIWHMGLSGSAPLLVATPGHFMEKEMGIIPVSQTIFSAYNLILTGISVIVILFMFLFVLPSKENIKTMADLRPDLMKPVTVDADDNMKITTPSQWLTYTPWGTYTIVVMFGVYLYYHFVQLGKSLDINILNFVFLMLIMLLYKTPAKFLKGVKAATPASWGVIIQFPFYAGIYGIMQYSGLVDIFAKWIISFSTAETYPAIVAFLSNVIGYFIPSGGSKWAIEAPFLIPAGHALGVPDAKTVIAYMFGCDWVALIQPFFAVPFIAVAGLEFKDFVGYTFIVYLVLGVVMMLGLTFIPF